jgi:flavodoxin
MRALVVFYSRDGHTREIGRKIAQELSCREEELKDAKNREGFFGWLGGGRDALRKKLTELKGKLHNPAMYDIVIIGTPVWAGRMAPAVRTYVSKNEHKFRKIALFSTAGSEDGEKALLEIEEICGKKPLAALPILARETGKEKTGKEIIEFCRKIRT